MQKEHEKQLITEKTELRGIIGDPLPLAAEKEMPRLDEHCRRFIGLATIVFVSSVGADGRADVSPRGDPPGFIEVLGDFTIALPDRPGNRRVDTMSNIVTNPEASLGLIFLVPGVEEVLRASGRAKISKDPALLASMTMHGKQPKLAIVIELDEVFFHCGKALKRARLWDPAAQIERKSFPSMAELIHEQRRPNKSLENIEIFIADNYNNELY